MIPDSYRMVGDIFKHLPNFHVFKISAFYGSIEFIGVPRVMLIMMKYHGLFVDMGLQCVKGKMKTKKINQDKKSE